MLFTWLRRYAEFNGRSSRKEYWLGILCLVLLSVGACIVDAIAFSGLFDRWDSGPTQLIVGLGTLVPSLALSVRRLHDIDRTGWWVLIGLIPIAGAIVLLIFALIRGTPGANRFGPAPPETPGLSGEPPAAASTPA